MYLDPTNRFSRRAGAYARGRPGYPPQIVAVLVRELGMPPGGVVAGLPWQWHRPLVRAVPFEAGLVVVGVEPNAEMRAAGDRALARYPRFRSVDGTAEATGLPASSVDLVMAAPGVPLVRPGRGGRRSPSHPAASGAVLPGSRRTARDRLAVRGRLRTPPAPSSAPTTCRSATATSTNRGSNASSATLPGRRPSSRTRSAWTSRRWPPAWRPLRICPAWAIPAMHR